ncbi:MAG TPA: protein phosphatase 2C domain-containing protein, partial [Nitrososphaeraceae archaeon]|nr:protein phosphatase 2C domain-containing protein [Nitrososphaeraceae archaeon]
MLQSGGKTDVGKIRENNEDSFYINNRFGIYIIADGIGGHKGGEIASKIATEYFGKKVSNELKSLNILDIKDNNHIQNKENVILEIIRKLILETNHQIIKESLQKNLYGMGTTIVMVLCFNNFFYLVNIGDSRGYIWDNKKKRLKQLTNDDSLVNEMLKMGKISVEESRNHKLKHVITKYLGSLDIGKPIIQKINWNNNDMLLLCTDGLTNVLEDKEIESVVNRLIGSELDTEVLEKNKKRNRSQEICDTLVELTNQTSGYDNITAVMIKNKVNLHKTTNVTD